MTYPGEIRDVVVTPPEAETSLSTPDTVTIREDIVEPAFVSHAQLYTFLEGTDEEAAEAVIALGFINAESPSRTVFEVPKERTIERTIFQHTNNSEQIAAP